MKTRSTTRQCLQTLHSQIIELSPDDIQVQIKPLKAHGKVNTAKRPHESPSKKVLLEEKVQKIAAKMKKKEKKTKIGEQKVEKLN